MKKINFYSLFFACFFTSFVFSQKKTTFTKNEIAKKIAVYKDSIKATFVNHDTSNCIDNRWLEELTTATLFNEMYADVTQTDIDSIVDFDLSTEILKTRLATLNSKTPINVEYTKALENVIKSFLKNRSKSFSRLMTLAQYYFPLFEEHLAKYNVPLEIKYLSIVESALNPKARSRVGATGLWQFMYPTGKHYNLEVNSYVDERYDPIKATDAACSYLSDLYGIFGDWSMALASYNAGPGNVSKAIRRSGGSQNYWNIRNYLPRETANYVPAFLATMYVFEYGKEYGIFPEEKKPFSYFETDTITVKKHVSFKQLSEMLDVSEKEIIFLNPIYKLNEIPFVKEKSHFVRLPKQKIGLFLSNEKKIYDYVTFVNSLEEKIKAPLVEQRVIYHKIRSGESLGVIANKYKVSIKQLKKWNNLRGTTIRAGKKLKIIKNYNSNTPKPTKHSKSTTSKTYIVKKGDSLYTISQKYSGVSVEDLKKWNNISGTAIHPGMKLKIKK